MLAQMWTKGVCVSRHHGICIALFSTMLAPLLQGAVAPQRGEIIGDDVYVNCEYRVAAQFPSEPKIRDITYLDSARTAPARQFYGHPPEDWPSGTGVHFAARPDAEPQAISNACETLPQRGPAGF